LRAGAVVGTRDHAPDPEVATVSFSYKPAMDFKLIMGNYVIVDHPNGEYGMYLP